MTTEDAHQVLGRIYPVSRETTDRLAIYVAELRRWQSVKNLIGPATLDEIWLRHVADSLQLLAFAPSGANRWLDLGSGAGLPGLVLAVFGAAERPSLHVDLVESNARKCAFLRHAIRATRANASVHHGRIENEIAAFRGRADVATARALAPLGTLCRWIAPLLESGALALFPKGRGVEGELTEAGECGRFAIELLPSRTDPDGRIVRITPGEGRHG